MEVNYSLDHYIKVFDNIFPEDVLENFLRICKESKNFEDAGIIGNKDLHTINKKIRNTFTWAPKNMDVKSLTEVHWTNLLISAFTKNITNYQSALEIEGTFSVNDVQILKYITGGHYKIHTDHAATIPRTYSCIFLVNDDYEGGDLIFKFPGYEDNFKIEKCKNRMIVWPSNFLYPHSVLPVIKGERYSVVAWAL